MWPPRWLSRLGSLVQRGRSPEDKEPSPSGGSRRPLWRTQSLAYVEMVGGLGLLVAINLLFFREELGFSNADPHPFWLVIIPIAARYGARPGYAVGALSAAVYLVLVASQTQPPFSPGSLGTRDVLDPVLFLLVGGLLGELRESQKRAHERLAARYDDLEESVRDLAQRYLASMELSRELERRIVGQTTTITTLYEAAKALDGLEVRELTPAVLELTSSFIDADACALYLRRDEKFVLEAALPANVDFERPDELDTTRGLPAIVLAERRTATVRDTIADASPGRIMGQRPLMAAPLLGEDREVIGILAVEKMPFLRFTPASVKLFALLGDWASSAFQRVLQFQQTRDRNVEDELTGAYSYPYVLKRLGEEILRAREYRLELSLLAVRIEDYASVSPVKVPSVLRTLSLVFRHHTRPIDILGKHADEGTFLIVLPHVDAREGRAIAGRLEREVEAFGFKPFDDDRALKVATGVASYTREVGGAEALVEEAHRNLDNVEGTSRR